MAHLLNSYAFPVDPILANPAVNPTAVVPNLEAFTLDCLDQMEILEPIHFAQNDVSDAKIRNLDRDDRA